MKSQKFKPPKCRGCGKSLLAVYENEYWTYNFDETTGTYRGNLVDIEVLCPDCHICLRAQFPEGICNYQAETRPNSNAREDSITLGIIVTDENTLRFNNRKP